MKKITTQKLMTSQAEADSTLQALVTALEDWPAAGDDSACRSVAAILDNVTANQRRQRHG